MHMNEERHENMGEERIRNTTDDQLDEKRYHRGGRKLMANEHVSVTDITG